MNTRGVIDLFEKSFAGWKSAGDQPQLIMTPVKLPDKTMQKVNTLADASRVEVVMGHLGIPRNHPDYYKFTLMNYILGGGPLVTRLGSGVRNKGLAYKVYSRLDTSIGEGPWAVRMTVDPRKVDRAISAVIRQVAYMQKKPPSPRELKDARFSLMGSMPVHLETNRNVAGMLLTIEYYRLGNDYLHNYHKVLKGITGSDVLSAAKKYLHPDKMYVIITGPYK